MAREFDLIARHFAPWAGEGGFGLTDDAALFRPRAGEELVITKDALVAGVHFFADDPPQTIGAKALAVNLSDLAAKGAEPRGFLLGMALPAAIDEAWLSAFSDGLRRMAESTGIALLGGDTVSTPGPLMLSITAFGAVPEGGMVRRKGARAGDALYVTGTIGDGALGLNVLLAEREGKPFTLADDHRAFLIDRYRVPRPRGAVASALRAHAHAAMDVSDGFVGDLTKLLQISGVGADIDLGAVPLSVATRALIRLDASFRDGAVTGGDDYEIIAAVSEASATAFERECLSANVRVTRIGTVTDSTDIRFLETDGTQRHFAKGSYEHGR